ncbi:MAG: RimK family alpha-L-glutamate ligase [Desulfurococcales archaeon]|nr:RimK family alpha-L-glutamate ligase [Desulfurococcales archaeon]
MTILIHLVSSISRMEESLIAEALSKWARIVNVNPRTTVFEVGEGYADAAVIRSISLYESIYTAAAYESNNVFTVNNSNSLVLAGDKMLTYSAMTRGGIPIPRTVYVPGSNGNPDIGVEYPAVSKPPVGSWGRLVSMVRNKAELNMILGLRNNMPCSIQRNLLVQEYIRTYGDIRCIVINGTLVGCMRRKPVKGDWRANIALGGRSEAFKPNPVIEEASLKAAGVIGGFFVSIDLFETEDSRVLVNEVNGVPEFKGFLRATGVNPAEVLSAELRTALRK